MLQTNQTSQSIFKMIKILRLKLSHRSHCLLKLNLIAMRQKKRQMDLFLRTKAQPVHHHYSKTKMKSKRITSSSHHLWALRKRHLHLGPKMINRLEVCSMMLRNLKEVSSQSRRHQEKRWSPKKAKSHRSVTFSTQSQVYSIHLLIKILPRKSLFCLVNRLKRNQVFLIRHLVTRSIFLVLLKTAKRIHSINRQA